MPSQTPAGDAATDGMDVDMAEQPVDTRELRVRAVSNEISFSTLKVLLGVGKNGFCTAWIANERT